MLIRIACTALLAVVPLAYGQQLVAEFTGTTSGFGRDVDTYPDIDGDGKPEIVVGIPDGGIAFSAGQLTMLSSKDGHSLLDVFGTSGQQLAHSFATLGDMDLDGFPDFVVGLPGDDNAAGQVAIFSGVTGAKLDSIDWSYELEQFGGGVGAVGDLNGDGLPDFGAAHLFVCGDLFGCLEGSAHIYSGGSLSEVPYFVADQQVRPAGNVDGDGHPDYLAWGEHSVRLCSGTSGLALDQLDDSAFYDVFAGGPAADVDGDGLREYVFAASSWPGSPVRISLRSFGKPPLLDIYLDDGDAIVAAVDARADVTGDGIPDIVVGMPSKAFSTEKSGVVRVYSAIDGSLLVHFDSTTTGATVNEFGGVLSALSDWNGDGVFDVVVGRTSDPFPSSPGTVAVFSAKGGAGWNDLGAAFPGSGGAPLLMGMGPLTPGSAVTIQLVDAADEAPVALVLGSTLLQVPFKGGVLVPAPDIVLGGLMSSMDGSVSLTAHWPGEAPAGFTAYMQAWWQDDGAVQGYAASNGLSATSQ